MPRSRAMAVRVAATARTWVTPPALPSTSDCETVCTESRMSSPGLTASMWASTADISVSAARKRFGWMQPIRSARIRTWAADSSPVMMSAGVWWVLAPACEAASSRAALPTPGAPASSTPPPGDQPAAEDPVQLGDTTGLGGNLAGVDLTDRPGRGGDRPRRDLAQHGLDRTDLGQAAPGLAVGAAASPFRYRRAAFGAVEGRLDRLGGLGRRTGGSGARRAAGRAGTEGGTMRERRVAGHDSNTSSGHRQCRFRRTSSRWRRSSGHPPATTDPDAWPDS